jgi:hypothetical protein
MHSPSPATPPSLDDLRTSESKGVISGSKDRGYFSRRQGLFTALETATQAGELQKAKVLRLLGNACSLRLDPEKLNEPFMPGVGCNGQAFALHDLGEADIALLVDMCPEIDDALTRARVADILWVLRRPRKLSDAKLAIDAYRHAPLDSNAWFLGPSRDCWRRAIVLALQIKDPGRRLLVEMESVLLAAIQSELDSGDTGPSMVEVLIEYGLAEAHVAVLASRLVSRANRLLLSSDGNRFFVARNYLALAKRCFGPQRSPENCADVDCAIADAFANQAASRIAGLRQNHAVGAGLYEDAIQALMVIPKHLRAARGVDQKLKEWRNAQRDAASRSTAEFGTVRSNTVDIGGTVQTVQEQIAGKPLTEALLAFAECWPLASRKQTESETRQSMGQFAFSRMFAAEKISRDGRVVARTPAAGDLASGSDSATQAVWSRMVEDHQFRVRYGVQSSIVPGWRQITLDHCVTEEDLINIVACSGAVPEDRVLLLAKGLKAGFEGDFIVALHLLTPQLEHWVRVHLKLKGAKTTTSNADGLQMEAGLSTLVALPEMKDVFGADLAFEVRALFCDAFGPNLRNEVAHGLLDAGALQSAESIYAWWLVFRTIYQQYWYR